MADEYQIIYEYTNGNVINFKTNDLTIDVARPMLHTDMRVDGTIVVTDPGYTQAGFSFTAVISGNDMDTLYGVQTAAIDYTGGYPRIQKIYWDGDSTETNVEVALLSLKVLDRGAGWWRVAITMVEKDQ